MIFRKYTEITNHYSKTVKEDWLNNSILANEKFVALNKIDGSNLSILYDGKNVEIAKRGDILPKDENFFNCKELMKKYYLPIQNMYDYLELKNGETLQIYGEICGGKYIHKDVERIKNISKIQGRCSYTPTHEFLVYDIALNIDEETRKFYNWHAVEHLCSTNNFTLVTEIVRGTLEEMLNFNVEFQDPTYKLFGFPQIENNFSEGVVIKPLLEQRDERGRRVIFKKKNEKFSEREQKKSIKPEIKLSEDEEKHLNILNSLINKNRLLSVISKEFDNITFKDFGNIMTLFSKDIIKDFEIETGKTFKDFENGNYLKKKVSFFAQNVVRDYIKGKI